MKGNKIQQTLDTSVKDGRSSIERMTSRRKLILHLDVQNTVTLTDSKQSISMRQALNTVLTSMVWGCYDPKAGHWSLMSKEPSLRRPEEGAVSFYKHSEKHLCKSAKGCTDADARQKFKRRISHFTEVDPMGRQFACWVESSLDKLKWEGELVKPCVMEQQGEMYHRVFPSVVRLLEHLSDNKRDFSVIFRTFGEDALAVMQSLQQILHMHGYHGLADSICMDLSYMRRENSTGKPILDVYSSDKHLKQYSGDQEIYKHLSGRTGISAIKDDYGHWQDRNYHYTAGKPLWINLEDTAHQHIMLDDNIREGETDSILAMNFMNRHRDMSNQWDGSSIEGVGIQIDTLAAIANKDYFVENVAKCEGDFAQMLM